VAAINRKIAEGSPAEASRLRIHRSVLEQSLDSMLVQAKLARSVGGVVLGQAQPLAAVRRSTPTHLLVGALVGLVVGIAAGGIAEYLDDSVRDSAALVAAVSPAASGAGTGRTVRVLGVIPQGARLRHRWLKPPKRLRAPTRHEAAATADEAYRMLRTTLRPLGGQEPVQVLQITSAASDDGAADVATNVAIAYARVGQRTVLADFNLRSRNRLGGRFGLRDDVDLEALSAGEVPLREALKAVSAEPQLQLLSPKAGDAAPSDTLARADPRKVLGELRTHADKVIVFTPPALPFPDSLEVADADHPVVLVARFKASRIRDIVRSAELFAQVGSPLSGVVLTGAGFGGAPSLGKAVGREDRGTGG
jgi:Mrp family chromosome partitioning ATPase